MRILGRALTSWGGLWSVFLHVCVLCVCVFCLCSVCVCFAVCGFVCVFSVCFLCVFLCVFSLCFLSVFSVYVFSVFSLCVFSLCFLSVCFLSVCFPSVFICVCVFFCVCAVCVCVELLKRSKTCTNVISAAFIYFSRYAFMELDSLCTCICCWVWSLALGWRLPLGLVFIWKQGAEVPMSFPLPTKLDDMWQGYKSGTPDLRTCKYLRLPLTWWSCWNIGHEGSFLGLRFKLLLPNLNTWNILSHELGTERAISLNPSV